MLSARELVRDSTHRDFPGGLSHEYFYIVPIRTSASGRKAGAKLKTHGLHTYFRHSEPLLEKVYCQGKALHQPSSNT